METGGVEPSTLTLSETARTALSSFSDDVEAKQALSGEYYEIRGWASKAAEQAARISGVLTSFANISASQVELPEMENAITLMNYYLGEAKRIATSASVSEAIRKAEKLRKWLIDFKYDETYSTEILQQGPNEFRDQKSLEGPIAVLVQYGWLFPLDKGIIIRGGSRQKAWGIRRP